jgi:hypothetical protein
MFINSVNVHYVHSSSLLLYTARADKMSFLYAFVIFWLVFSKK